MMKGWKSLAPNIGRCWSDVDDDTSPSWMPKEMEWVILRLFWSIRISNFENHGDLEWSGPGGDSGRVWNEVCLHHIIGDFSYPAAFAGFYRGSKVSTVEVQMCVNDFSERYICIIKKLAQKKTYFATPDHKKDTKGPVRYGALITHKFPTVLALLVPLGMRFFAEKLMFSRTVSLWEADPLNKTGLRLTWIFTWQIHQMFAKWNQSCAIIILSRIVCWIFPNL